MTRGRPRTVLLADAQPLLRAGLRSILLKRGLDVVAEASTADVAVAEAERARPGACLVAADLPGGGILTVRRIRDRLPETAVLVIVSSVNADVVLAAVRAGADGLVTQTTTALGLERTVSSVLEGQAAIPRAALAALVHEFRGGRQRASLHGHQVSLTAREAQVLELLRENMTTAQIARELDMSQVTVRRHVGGIAAKVGSRSRGELLSLMQVA